MYKGKLTDKKLAIFSQLVKDLKPIPIKELIYKNDKVKSLSTTKTRINDIFKECFINNSELKKENFVDAERDWITKKIKVYFINEKYWDLLEFKNS